MTRLVHFLVGLFIRFQEWRDLPDDIYQSIDEQERVRTQWLIDNRRSEVDG